MQNSTTAKELRNDLFKGISGYTEDRLIEDLRKIYQLAELDPPTSSEIYLETRRESIKLESTTQNSSNPIFKRLSIDKSKQESNNQTNISSSNLRDKTPELVVHEYDNNNIKQDQLMNTSINSSMITPHHSTDHNISVLNDAKHDLHQIDQINNNTIQNGTKQTSYNHDKEIKTKLPDPLYNTDMITTNKINSQSFINNHEIHHSNSMNKLKTNKVTIIYALSHESTEADAVEQYLNSTSADERDRLRKRVIITHAYSKVDNSMDHI
ncbi:unnamed protein product [Schistosoma mattheei]|nr:unnamed protein product [Schistosoma mattheei]